MNRTDIYGQAVKRTFANVHGDVSWTTGKTIAVQCAGERFLHPILSDPDDDVREFTCLDEDPVIVNLTEMNGTSWNSPPDFSLTAVRVTAGT